MWLNKKKAQQSAKVVCYKNSKRYFVFEYITKVENLKEL